jgi:hypothetical protein
MLQQPDTDAHWQDALAGMQTDSRFRRFKKFRYYGEVDGAKIGAVIANKGSTYNNYALNCGDVEDLLAAKRDGKVDFAFIVAVADGAYVTHRAAETYYTGLLVNLQPRSGQFGNFWTLTHHEMTGEEEPF